MFKMLVGGWRKLLMFCIQDKLPMFPCLVNLPQTIWSDLPLSSISSRPLCRKAEYLTHIW